MSILLRDSGEASDATPTGSLAIRDGDGLPHHHTHPSVERAFNRHEAPVEVHHHEAEPHDPADGKGASRAFGAPRTPPLNANGKPALIDAIEYPVDVCAVCGTLAPLREACTPYPLSA